MIQRKKSSFGMPSTINPLIQLFPDICSGKGQCMDPLKTNQWLGNVKLEA